MKTKLTKKEIKLMNEVRDEWIERFNKLEFDEKKARKLIKWLYLLIDKKKPKILILDSPLACQIAGNVLYRSHNQVSNQVRDQTWDQVEIQVWRHIWGQVDSQVWKQVSNQVRDQIWKQVSNQTWDQVSNHVRDQVWDQVSNQVWKQVDNEVTNQINSKVSKQVSNQTWDQVSNHVRDQVWKQVDNEVTNQINSKVSKQVRDQVDSQVWKQVSNQVRDQIWKQVSNQTWDQVSNHVRDQVWDQVSNQVWKQVDNEVTNQTWDQIYNQIWGQVGRQVISEVKEQVDSQKLVYLYTSYYGNVSDYGWLSFYDYFRRIGILKNEKFEEFMELSKCGIFYLLLTYDFAFISRPPKYIKRLGNGRMHSKDGYAIEFNDGYGQHYVEGVYFDPQLFENVFIKKTMTGKDIINIRNTEQKAILIKHFGYEKIISELNNVDVLEEITVKSKITGKDCIYKLLEFDINEARIRVICVEDHTVHKKTFLSVPRTKKTETCKGAIAWTFNVPTKDYIPVMET